MCAHKITAHDIFEKMEKRPNRKLRPVDYNQDWDSKLSPKALEIFESLIEDAIFGLYQTGGIPPTVTVATTDNLGGAAQELMEHKIVLHEFDAEGNSVYTHDVDRKGVMLILGWR